jgi:hypothetical protein
VHPENPKLGNRRPEMAPKSVEIGEIHIKNDVLADGTLLRLRVSVMKTKGILNIEDFKRASFEKKCDVVTTQSNYILTRTLGNCKVYLYHSGDFFIEVFYSPIYKKVLMINAFNDSESLIPYAENVTFNSLGLAD